MEDKNNKQETTEHKQPKKLGAAFAVATLGLGTVTAVAAFQGATGIAVPTGVATGLVGSYTAFRLFAEGMSA